MESLLHVTHPNPSVFRVVTALTESPLNRDDDEDAVNEGKLSVFAPMPILVRCVVACAAQMRQLSQNCPFWM
jgi:hypothetical protein